MNIFTNFVKKSFFILFVCCILTSSFSSFLASPIQAATIPLTVAIEGGNPSGSGGTPSVYSNSPWLTMWFKSDPSEAPFDKTTHYQVHFEIPNCNINCTYDAYPNSDNPNLNTDHQLVAHITANGQFPAGRWVYKLGVDNTEPDNLLYEGTFIVYPSGGKNGLPALQAPTLIKKADPKVPISILNTANNSQWSVWIDGNHSTVYTITNNPNGGDIHANADFSNGDSKDAVGDKKLCMTNKTATVHGQFSADPLTCDYSVKITIDPLSPTQPGNTVDSNPTGTPTQTTTTTVSDNPGDCNPKCPSGFTCGNIAAYAAETSGGGGLIGTVANGIGINNAFPGVNACIPDIPPPTACKTDYDCVPYTCVQQRCSLSPIPTPTPYSTPSPLCPNNRCDTALGIIPTQPAAFIAQILIIVLSFAGGIAMLLIINAGYRIMISGGNPEKLQEAREGLTAALVGLLFIIFSVALLQLITINILHIPGFSQ